MATSTFRRNHRYVSYNTIIIFFPHTGCESKFHPQTVRLSKGQGSDSFSEVGKCLDWCSLMSEHFAAVHWPDSLHQLILQFSDSFVLQVFWGRNKKSARKERTKVSRKLKSCCHEEYSISLFLCFQCCSSPVQWQTLQSHRTKKRICFSLQKKLVTVHAGHVHVHITWYTF